MFYKKDTSKIHPHPSTSGCDLTWKWSHARVISWGKVLWEEGGSLIQYEPGSYKRRHRHQDTQEERAIGEPQIEWRVHSRHHEEQEETREDSVQNLEGAWRCGSLDFRLPGPSVRGDTVEGSHVVCEGSPSQ